MKRVLIAALAAALMFGAVFAVASTLDVSDATAATGNGDVAACGDITGSTFILESQSLVTAGDDLAGNLNNIGPADISEFKAVNIESVTECDMINVFVEVRDGENGAGNVIASGTCQISGDGVVGSGPDDDGLGFDELGTGDNGPGCTAIVGNDTTADDDLPDVVAAESLVVTVT
jgi:hypothetical protein